MSRSLGTLATLTLLLLPGCATQSPPQTASLGAPPRQAQSPPIGSRPAARTAVLLSINDVYRIEGVEGGRLGGFGRLRTLRGELEREHPDLLVFHAGDMLFPSFLSRAFNGEQMIDVLNRLDGDDRAFDPRLFAVFGNHEFDKDKRKDAPLLAQRVHDSQFRWLDGNVDFARGDDGKPLIAGDNLAATWMVESGGIRIGIFGLTVGDKKPQYVTGFRQPLAVARELTAALRAQGAEVVVALTHLRAEDDRQILRELGAQGPDLILGGHDHQHMACDVGGRMLLKADADARTATVVRLTLRADGHLDVSSTLRELDASLPEDCAVQGTIDSWLALHEGLFCGQDAGRNATPATPVDPHCLEKKLGTTETLLEAEESKIRGRETSLGDWVAERMLEPFRECGAQAAFINSGSLRLNQDLAPGSTLRRRHVEELFAYPAPVYELRIDGRTLRRVVEHAIAGWPGSGNWLQIAGFSFEHDTAAGKVSNLQLITPSGPRPVTDDEVIRVVVNQYLFDATGDRDGYTMLGADQVDPDCAVNQRHLDLKTNIVLPALERAGTIAPRNAGRIRQVPAAAQADPCAPGGGQ